MGVECRPFVGVRVRGRAIGRFRRRGEGLPCRIRAVVRPLIRRARLVEPAGDPTGYGGGEAGRPGGIRPKCGGWVGGAVVVFVGWGGVGDDGQARDAAGVGRVGVSLRELGTGLQLGRRWVWKGRVIRRPSLLLLIVVLLRLLVVAPPAGVLEPSPWSVCRRPLPHRRERRWFDVQVGRGGKVVHGTVVVGRHRLARVLGRPLGQGRGGLVAVFPARRRRAARATDPAGGLWTAACLSYDSMQATGISSHEKPGRVAVAIFS